MFRYEYIIIVSIHRFALKLLNVAFTLTLKRIVRKNGWVWYIQLLTMDSQSYHSSHNNHVTHHRSSLSRCNIYKNSNINVKYIYSLRFNIIMIFIIIVIVDELISESQGVSAQSIETHKKVFVFFLFFFVLFFFCILV